MSEQKTERLPKWAQTRIATLTGQVEYLEAELAKGPENSNTFANARYPNDGQPLGNDARVRFVVETYADGKARVYFDAHLEGAELVLSASEGVLIQPWSSNVARVRMAR